MWLYGGVSAALYRLVLVLLCPMFVVVCVVIWCVGWLQALPHGSALWMEEDTIQLLHAADANG